MQAQSATGLVAGVERPISELTHDCRATTKSSFGGTTADGIESASSDEAATMTAELNSLEGSEAPTRSVSGDWEPVLKSQADSPSVDLASLVATDMQDSPCKRCMSIEGFERTSAQPPIRSMLGKGTWGHVWRALDPKSGRKFAVKHTLPTTSATERDVLLHLQQYPHQCLVQPILLHKSSRSDLCDFVMELYTGGDLLMAICRGLNTTGSGKRLYHCPELAEFWLAQILLALEHLHLVAEVLHLDVKPNNVLLSDAGVVKLADFGSGHIGLQAPGPWITGVPPGSPGYVAPEVFLQEPHGPKADLYSFGALAWALITGEQPPTRFSSIDPGRFWVLSEDYQLLLGALRNDERRQANEQILKADMRELLLGLCAKRSSERASIEEIREAAWARRFALPDARSSPAEISHWLMAGADTM